MLLEIAEEVAPLDDMTKWIDLQQKLPKLLYDEDGSLKEWASYSFEENNKHRHFKPSLLRLASCGYKIRRRTQYGGDTCGKQ